MGLVPKYRNKKDFGSTPNYIVKRADEMRRAQEEYDLYVKEHMRRGAMKQVGGAEHEEILMGLKQNWEEAMLQYQCLPVVCDNLYRKHTKERLEADRGGGHAPVPVSPSCMRQPVPKTHKRTIGSPAEEYRERHRAIRKAQNDLRGLTTPPPNSAPSPTRNNFTRISQQRPNINSNKTRNTSHELIRSMIKQDKRGRSVCVAKRK